jgi:hypothetical protein
MKLDAGSDKMLARLNGDWRSARQRVEGLRGLRDIVIEGMFVQDSEGELDNTLEPAVTDWIAMLEQIRPALVHIGTMAATPPNNRLIPASVSSLMEIASRVRAAGFAAEVFAEGPATGYPYSYLDRKTGHSAGTRDRDDVAG